MQRRMKTLKYQQQTSKGTQIETCWNSFSISTTTTRHAARQNSIGVIELVTAYIVTAYILLLYYRYYNIIMLECFIYHPSKLKPPIAPCLIVNFYKYK